ncbi:MAG: phosphotransferase family protein [Halioglobus sp.]
MSDQETFLHAVSAAIQKNIAEDARLINCQQLSAGASQETYRVQYQTDSGEATVALRRAQPTAGEDSSVGGMGLELEAEVIRCAHSHSIPTPRVLYTLQPEDNLGRGFFMQWLEGETLGQRIVAAPELEATRKTLARSCGEILGKIHAIEWQGTALEKELPVVDPAQLVEETYQAYLALDIPVPVIDYSWRWLNENLPTQSRTTLVHGDFRNGNLMVVPEGINAVLDWELAHIGDPLRDLGWLCVNSWRFGNSELAVGGFGVVDEMLAGYRQTSGVSVAKEALKFWQVFGSFWWAMVTLQMANSWRSGETPSLERPVIGRRSSEAQMDCVNLLFPGQFELPQDNTLARAGTQLPMPEELLSGVIQFLKHEAAPKLEGHNHFLARVAANSLRIAQSELRHGAAAGEAERQRLSAIVEDGGSLDELRWKLVHQLRGDMPLDSTQLQHHLRQTVAVQLFIDQPRYSALKQP